MNRILADLMAFGRQYLRSRIGAFFVFIFPILLILLFGAIFSQTGSSSVTVPVQDLDNSLMSRGFLSALNNTTVVKMSMISPTVDLQSYIKDNSLSVALLIPRGFQDQVLASVQVNGTSHVNVTLYGDPSKSTLGQVEGVMEAVAEQMNFKLVGASRIINVDVRRVASSQYTYMDYFLPGIVGMTIMTSAMYSMTSICGEYRTRRYFKLLATTTLSKAEWLVSKILFYSLILIVSLVVTVGVGIAVWGVHITIDGMVIAFIVVGALLFTSLGMLFGTIVKDPESGVALANAIGFPMMFLSGSFWPVESMPSYLQTVAKVLPLTYVNEGLRDAMIFGNVESALVNLGIVAVLAALCFVVAAKLVSWKER